MNTRVNIYIFTQIYNHIYFPPDLVQQSQLSEKLMVVTIISREITKKKEFQWVWLEKKKNWLHKIILAVQKRPHPPQPLARHEAAPQSYSLSLSVCYIAFLHDAT